MKFLIVFALFLLLPSSVQAATRVGIDFEHAAEFRLNDHSLSVSVSSDTPKSVKRKLSGYFIVGCGPNFDSFTYKRVYWPAGAKRISLRLPRNVSATANVCVVGRKGELSTLRTDFK